jgi:pyrroline-5-carboxylate reductase
MTAQSFAMTSNRGLEQIRSLALVGAGKMGGAILEGWLALGLDPRAVAVIEPHPSAELQALAKRGVSLNPASPGTMSVMVIAVKPQVAAAVLSEVAPLAGEGTLAVSIMAGKTLDFLQRFLPKAAVVRAMPNTPAAIGRGITVAVPGHGVTAAQRDLANRLLAATGSVEWVADESLMDAVTALSGSGPAYVFLLAEAMAAAGKAAGLPDDLAERLAHQTISGAGELMRQADLHPSILRKNVTSPGGTTAAALDVLMSPEGLERLMTRAVAAATKRSKELAG